MHSVMRTVPMARPVALLALLILALPGGAADAAPLQQFYIDFGSNSGAPSGRYDAPASAPDNGVWNGIATAPVTDYALIEADNEASQARMTLTGNTVSIATVPSSGFACSYFGPCSNTPILGDFFQATQQQGGDFTLSFAGLSNGTYDLLVYIPGYGSAATSNFTVQGDGDAAGLTVGNVVYNGSNSSILIEDVRVSAGGLSIVSGSNTAGINGFGLAGIQLLQTEASDPAMPAPAPALVSLFALGLLGLRRAARP